MYDKFFNNDSFFGLSENELQNPTVVIGLWEYAGFVIQLDIVDEPETFRRYELTNDIASVQVRFFLISFCECICPIFDWAFKVAELWILELIIKVNQLTVQKFETLACLV